MSAILNAALDYAARGWPVFPCVWHRESPRFKRPLVADWDEVATCDPAQIRAWWSRWPHALIGMPSGRPDTFVVLDVDVKNQPINGFDTLGALGFAILPPTRMVHTSTGGLHLHFDQDEHEIRNTAGKRGRGIGAGLDWRGTGGYVILPSPGSGYTWDSSHGFDYPLATIPPELLPREPVRIVSSSAKPIEPEIGLSRYAEAALDSACRAIIRAPCGEQDNTLWSEVFSIATLAGAGAIPERFAHDALLWAAGQMPSYDRKRPWPRADIEDKVARAFAAGKASPRRVLRHG
jgi:putative DNA primase/helicase